MSKSKKKHTIKSENLHNKSKTELLKILKETYEEWWSLKMDLKLGKAKDLHAAGKKRRQIARIKTIIKEKELEKVTK